MTLIRYWHGFSVGKNTWIYNESTLESLRTIDEYLIKIYSTTEPVPLPIKPGKLYLNFIEPKDEENK